MATKPIIDVIIPAYNEEQSIGLVLDEIPKSWVRNVVVANNNSSDRTGEVAKEHGAIVVFQPEPGYGNACLKAMDFIAQQEVEPDIIVFLDGDYSDYPEQLPEVVQPIIDENADIVIGSRALGKSESGSLTPQQVFP